MNYTNINIYLDDAPLRSTKNPFKNLKELRTYLNLSNNQLFLNKEFPICLQEEESYSVNDIGIQLQQQPNTITIKIATQKPNNMMLTIFANNNFLAKIEADPNQKLNALRSQLIQTNQQVAKLFFLNQQQFQIQQAEESEYEIKEIIINNSEIHLKGTSEKIIPANQKESVKQIQIQNAYQGGTPNQQKNYNQNIKQQEEEISSEGPNINQIYYQPNHFSNRNKQPIFQNSNNQTQKPDNSNHPDLQQETRIYAIKNGSPLRSIKKALSTSLYQMRRVLELTQEVQFLDKQVPIDIKDEINFTLSDIVIKNKENQYEVHLKETGQKIEEEQNPLNMGQQDIIEVLVYINQQQFYSVKVNSTDTLDKFRSLQKLNSTTVFLMQNQPIDLENENQYKIEDIMEKNKTKWEIFLQNNVSDEQIAQNQTAKNQNKILPKQLQCELIENKKGLDIYLYPIIQPDPRQVVQPKVILFVGQTGSGKSTLLDAMINYLAGVELGDTYRFKLVDERESQKKKNCQAHSQTESVKQYYIKDNIMKQPIILLDTPGFMDTRGVDRDSQITAMIKQYFEQKLDKIDLVCLVCISSQARLTVSQQYVFNKLLEIFGKDIEENLVLLLTFCDGADPQVIDSIKEEKVPYTNMYKFNNSALFQPKQSGKYEPFTEMFWKMGQTSLQQFFTDLPKYPSRSLILTKQVLQRRDTLNAILAGIRPQIDLLLVELNNAKRLIQDVKNNQAYIESNKNYMVEIEDPKIEKQQLQQGQYTTLCIKCNYTCHKICAFGNDQDKDKCAAITNGQCTVCQGKCHWSEHHNVDYILVYSTVKKKIKRDELYKRYSSAQNQLKNTKDLLNALRQKFEEILKELITKLQIMKECINELDNIALRPNMAKGCEIFQMMIKQEERDKRPGYQERIDSLSQLLKNYQLLENASKGNEEILKMWLQDYEIVMNEWEKIDNTINFRQSIQNQEKSNRCIIF